MKTTTTRSEAARLLTKHMDLVQTVRIDGHTLELYRDPLGYQASLWRTHWLVVDGARPTRYRHFEAARGAWLAQIDEWQVMDRDYDNLETWE